jgi:hypothetical protein
MLNSFNNNIDPYYRDEKGIKIPTKVSGNSYGTIDMARGIGTI